MARKERKNRYSAIVDFLDIDAIEEAIGFDPLYQTDTEDTGRCPDIWGLHTHGDTTGKFSINREKKVYNCWVCGGGSLLSLIMEMYNYSPDEATAWLKQYAEGSEDSDKSADRMKDKLNEVKSPTSTALPYFNERVLDRFETEHPFFASKLISQDVVEQYKLRFNPHGMKRPPKNKDEETYEGPCIIFPHFWKGRLVGWQNRWLEPSEKELKEAKKFDCYDGPIRPKWVAKYTNTTDFPREDTLFNYESALRSKFEVVICESVPTVLFLESCGVTAIATFGATINASQMKLLRRLQQGVLIATDNDKAGRQCRRKLTDYLERYTTVEHVPFVGEEGSHKDLADLADYELALDYLARSHPPLTEADANTKE